MDDKKEILISTFKFILQKLYSESYCEICPGEPSEYMTGWTCEHCSEYFPFNIQGEYYFLPHCPCNRYSDNIPLLMKEVKKTIEKLENDEIKVDIVSNVI